MGITNFRNLNSGSRLRFVYDPLIRFYYFGNTSLYETELVSYGNEPIMNSMFILAVNQDGNKLWSHDMDRGVLAAIVTAEHSNVYMSGFGSAKFQDQPYVNSFVRFEFPSIKG